MPLFSRPTEAYYIFNYQKSTSYVTIYCHVSIMTYNLMFPLCLCRVSEKCRNTSMYLKWIKRYHYITVLVLPPNLLYLTIFTAFCEV